MKTIVLQQPGKFEYTDTTPEGPVGPEEVLVKVHSIGICGTDIHAFAGNQPFFSYPRVLGHELGVEVVEVGAQVSQVAVGDRCSVEPYLNAGNDQAVRNGFTNCGENVSVLGVHQDGGMRESFKLPAKYLHKSSKLSYDQLALVEPLGIGCHAVNRAQVSSQDTVLVIGLGPIGLAATEFALATGARVVIMDINQDRISFAADMMNIHGSVLAGNEKTEKNLRNQFDGDLPNIVFDATGNRHSMAKAMEFVSSAGKLVFIGLFQGDFSFADPYFHKKEMTLMASRNALPTDFQQIIRMMEEGKINTDKWITHRSAFDKMIQNFDEWLKPESKVIKAMVSLD